MVGDRGRSLTVRAAVRGVIDFRRADLRSVNWWRRAALLIGEMARQDDAAVIHASYLFHLALVANGSLDGDGFKGEQKKALATYNDFVSAVMPWSERVRRQRQLEDVKYLSELYKKVCGDPDDPITRERWKRESAELEAMTNQPDPSDATMDAVRKAMAKPKERPKAVALD